MNTESQTPVAVTPASPVITLPPAAAAPVITVAVTQSAAPVNPVAARPRKGAKKGKAQVNPVKV